MVGRTRIESAGSRPVVVREPSDRDQSEEATVISTGAYLRSMAAIAWVCIRSPFSATVIDLSTGEVIQDASSSDSHFTHRGS